LILHLVFEYVGIKIFLYSVSDNCHMDDS
jgi:hypothetical protein